jgi:WD40 repeat protein
MSRGRILAGLILAFWASWKVQKDGFSTATANAQVHFAQSPIVVPECRISVIHKEEVPSQRDGIICLIGTDIRPGDMIAPEQIVNVQIGNEKRKYRRLNVGDAIVAGQLLARLDDRLAQDEYEIKRRKLLQSQADFAAAEKTRDEALERYKTQLKLRQERATSEEELAGAQLAWYRTYYDAISKQEAVALAQLEQNQAQTVLSMYEIRSTISGVIKTIYKSPGEAVKIYEPIFQVWDPTNLRIEGLVDVEHLASLRIGMTVSVEVPQSGGPQQILIGHLQDITGVDLSPSSRNANVVSASADGTVRIWDRTTGHELRIFRHPTAVRAVACTKSTGGPPLCLSGVADGTAWLWDLNNQGDLPLRKLTGCHRGAITSVAFSLNGNTCVTGGEDHELNLWDTATGERRFSFPRGHAGPITSLQFLPNGQLISAGRDNTIRVWTLGKTSAILETTFDSRSGDVACPGAGPDGKTVLFDQGRELRLLSLPAGLTEGILQNPSSADFASFALFSPDGRLIVTAANSSAELQLWNAPTPGTRGRLVRKLVAPDNTSPTCAAFSIDGSFLATGTKSGKILIWSVPDLGDLERSLTAKLTLVEKSVESSARQIRIWADLANPDARLIPGTTVNLIVNP